MVETAAVETAAVGHDTQGGAARRDVHARDTGAGAHRHTEEGPARQDTERGGVLDSNVGRDTERGPARRDTGGGEMLVEALDSNLGRDTGRGPARQDTEGGDMLVEALDCNLGIRFVRKTGCVSLVLLACGAMYELKQGQNAQAACPNLHEDPLVNTN